MIENPFIHLRSAKFPIQPGEDAELVNPNTYGKALAEYLQTRLIERGYRVPFVCCEDWGWWVELKGQPFTLGLLVRGFAMEDRSLDLCVQVSAEPERRWSWTRFRFIDRAPTVEQLNRDLKEIVESDPAIRVLRYTQDFPLAEGTDESVATEP
jgi:hypothetical protein